MEVMNSNWSRQNLQEFKLADLDMTHTHTHIHIHLNLNYSCLEKYLRTHTQLLAHTYFNYNIAN